MKFFEITFKKLIDEKCKKNMTPEKRKTFPGHFCKILEEYGRTKKKNSCQRKREISTNTPMYK